MTEPASEGPTAPTPPPAGPKAPVRPFNDAVTALCTLVLVFGGIFSVVGSASGTQYFQLFRQPLASTAQYFDRSMELAEAPVPSAPWLTPLRGLLITPVEEVRGWAIRELKAALELHAGMTVGGPPEEVRLVEGRLALLLGEAGQREPLQVMLSSLAAQKPEGARLAAVLRFAYGLSDTRPEPGELEAVIELLSDPRRPRHTWATDRLASHLHRRLGQEAEALAAEARISERGVRAQARELWLSGGMIALVLAGLLLWLGRWVSRKPLPRLASGVSPAPWSGAEGYALSVRCITFAQAGFLCTPDESPTGLLLGSLIGWVPMLVYLTQRVPAAYGLRLSELFGLRLKGPVSALLMASLVLIAIEQLFVIGLGLAGRELGLERWYEGVQEDLMRGTPAEAAGFVVSAVLGAPLFEEIALRGVVYTSLRVRFGPWTSAVVSAGLFSLLHVYSPLGMLSLFTSAVASALVYERTRSLLPCIIAHGLNNAALTAIVLLVDRGA
jgi:membrane protease YdiL (CAAX protease family)